MKIANITATEVTVTLDPADCKALSRVCEVAADTTWFHRDDTRTAVLYSGLAAFFIAAGFAAVALDAVPERHRGSDGDADFGGFIQYYDVPEPPEEGPPAA